MRAWARRASSLHEELSSIADVDRRWWLIAGGAAAAESWRARISYVLSDAEPSADTFIGQRVKVPSDPVRDAIARAHAARLAVRELEGQLPDQPLAVTLRRNHGATTEPSALDVAAFAIGDHCVLARLADDVADESSLAAQLSDLLRGRVPPALPRRKPSPFVTVSIGDEPIATARHGHRRAWIEDAGPWLGMGRSGELAVVSTCHMAIDGFGHTLLTSKIAAHHARLYERAPSGGPLAAPALAEVPGGVPLGIAWRELPDGKSPRALPLGYALGRLLHRAAGRTGARFSPTFQIPVAPGHVHDPLRRRRRVVPAAISVRFEHGEPEPYAVFEARARDTLTREAEGRGLCARLMSAARAAPLSVAWKRKTFSAARPGWLDRLAEVVGGRACLSRIRVDAPVAPSCAVSSPARLASPHDPLGACVICVIDDGSRAAITACGSGLAGSHAHAADVIEELLALL